MENMQEKIQAHEQRVRRLNGVWDNFQRQQEEREQQNPRSVMFNALGGKNSPLNAPEKMNLVQKALYASEDEVINDGENNKKLSQFVNDLAEAIEKDTFYFEQANSIERINCETTTMNEYFTWIEEGQTIIKDMNDGEVTQADADERDSFFQMSFQRETELLTCLGLYERSIQMGNTDAKAKFDELRLKLQKLREIRSAIQVTCNHEVDRKVERNEYEVAVEYYRLLGLMRQMGLHPTRTQIEEFREKSIAFKVDHGIDVEMLPGYSFYTRLLEDVRHADRRERDMKEQSFDHSLSYNRSPGEFLYMAKHVEAKEDDIRTRIERLRGLRPPHKDIPAYDGREMRRRALTREGIQEALSRLAQREAMERA